MTRKYDVSGDTQFEPGSRRLVLKNLMGIKTKRAMDEVENVALKQAEDYLFGLYGAGHRFTDNDICDMHKIWLGRIYPWAGGYRDVDLTKGIRFAHAKHISKLMRAFSDETLLRYTPCNFKSKQEIVDALAVTHVEFVLIHPFREGNGRIARVLTTLMALQAGLPILNFKPIELGRGKQQYFEAIRAGFDRKYDAMRKVIDKILKLSLANRAEK